MIKVVFRKRYMLNGATRIVIRPHRILYNYEKEITGYKVIKRKPIQEY